MTTDAQAIAIATRALPAEPRGALHMALIVGRTETHYGDNWDAAGAGSNNWGAVQARGGQPSFDHLDHHADGSPYTGKFRTYPTPDAGFKDLAFEVLKPNVLQAAQAGNGTAAVLAMHDNGYFELDPAKYVAAVEKQYNGFLASSGEPRLLSFPDVGNVREGAVPPGTPPAGSGGGSLIETGVVIAAALGLAWALDVLKPAKPAPKAAP